MMIRPSTGFLQVYLINRTFIIFDLCNLNNFCLFNLRNENKTELNWKDKCARIPIIISFCIYNNFYTNINIFIVSFLI